MRASKKKILVAVAWPYVNGDLHIGHLAGYLLPADICARYNRLIGNDVLMVSGSDCFGTPITVEADKRKLTPADIVQEYHNKDLELFFDILHLSYDKYTLTNNETHIKLTQDFFIKFLEAGYIFIDTQKQYYSATENRFLPDRYVVGQCPHCGYKDSRSDQCDNCGKLLAQGDLIHPLSNISKEPVILKDTEHYFIDWPKLQKNIKSYVESAGGSWKEWVSQETNGWLEEGLKPRAITRDLDWGVPIPTDRMPADKVVAHVETKRIYVWFDAVIGYLSASMLWAKELGENHENDWKKFWYEGDTKHFYFMGKDNLVFHTIFWPGQLMVYDHKLHLPDVVSINMFLNYDGRQFSKSRGISLPIRDMVEKYGNDAVRFYLTLIMPESKDASFVWSDFNEKINGVLVATLGNFIHRVLSIGKGLSFENTEISTETKQMVEDSYATCRLMLEKCEFRAYLNEILQLASYGNSLVNNLKIWELKSVDSVVFSRVMGELVYLILAIRELMTPLLFEASDKLSNFMGLEKVSAWPDQQDEHIYLLSQLDKVVISNELSPLFTKIIIEKETPKL